MEWSRVVLLHGARQCGKSTLARIIVERQGGTYVSLDDEAERQIALTDPVTFLLNRRYPLAVDEIQLGGDGLVRAVKQIVDADTAPGRFLLTGSTNFLTVPTISESLAGRIQIFRLWPFSEAELAGVIPTVVDRWFDETPAAAQVGGTTRDEYLALACRGGYPEAIGLTAQRRLQWFRGYIETVTQRDIAALADIRKVATLGSLLEWTAGMTAGSLNVSDAARSLQTSRSVIAAYLEWLQTVFLVHELPAWGQASHHRQRPSRRHPQYRRRSTRPAGSAADGTTVGDIRGR